MKPIEHTEFRRRLVSPWECVWTLWVVGFVCYAWALGGPLMAGMLALAAVPTVFVWYMGVRFTPLARLTEDVVVITRAFHRSSKAVLWRDIEDVRRTNRGGIALLLQDGGIIEISRWLIKRSDRERLYEELKRGVEFTRSSAANGGVAADEGPVA